MKKDTDRKEYRVCLNLNNPYHRYVEEQIQKMAGNGRSSTEMIIKSLYDYFHQTGFQKGLQGCLETLQKNLLQELGRRDQVPLPAEKEPPVEQESHPEPERSIPEPERKEEPEEDSSGWNIPFPEEGSASRETEEPELSPGVLDFMKAFN